MSDIMPKVKLYIIISLISLIMNIGVVIYGMIISTNTDISGISMGSAQIVLSLAGSFIPFVSFIGLATMEIPLEITAIIGIFTGILSSVQALIIVFMVLQIVANILWNPDV